MSIGSADLAGVLWTIGGFLLAIGVIAGLVRWIARRRGSRTVVLDTALVTSAVWVALVVIGTPFALAQTLGDDSIYVRDMPISTEWPGDVRCFDEGEKPPAPYIDCASLTSANAWIVGLPLATRALLALGQLSSNLLILLPAALIAMICFLMLRGRPFAAVVARAFAIGAGVVLVAGLCADIAPAIGRGLAAQAVLPAAGDGDLTAGPAFQISVQLWPFGAALALAALAAVFRYGGRLQRDTAGLV